MLLYLILYYKSNECLYIVRRTVCMMEVYWSCKQTVYFWSEMIWAVSEESLWEVLTALDELLADTFITSKENNQQRVRAARWAVRGI